MPKPKRNLLATVEDTLTPPDTLTSSQAIARIVKAAGKNLYSAELPDGKAVLVELEPKFRSTIWIKRGSYVVIDDDTLAERDNKLDGEIVNVVRDEKAWRKMSYWYVESMLCCALGVFWSFIYSGIDTNQARKVCEEVDVCRG
jgi:probable RNA-binding protein EIF1AD